MTRKALEAVRVKEKELNARVSNNSFSFSQRLPYLTQCPVGKGIVMTVITFSTQRSKYEYETYPINSTTWNSVGGNYIFSFETQTGWVPLYVGQTNNFKARFSNHDKLPLAIKRGATHILAHVNTSDQSRMSEEADLINWFKPVLNELLK